MNVPNWKVIKNEYEILGSSIKELATSHHTTEALIRAAIEDGNWEQTTDPDELDTTDLSSRLEVMEVRHQAALVPRFISLQAKMLEKCDMLLDGVKDLDDSQNLKVVSEVIEKHRPAIMGDKDKNKDADKGLTIRIMNKVGDSDAENVSVSAVEITQSAGQTNGVGVPHGTPVH